MKMSKSLVAPFLVLIGILSMGTGEAAAQSQLPTQATVRPLQGSAYSQSYSGGLMPAGAKHNMLSALMGEEWQSLPTPYNRNVAELNDMLSYDTPQVTGALVYKIWAQEPAPFSRNIYELNALRQQYLRATGTP